MEPQVAEEWRLRDKHALQLGRLCISWAILDDYLDKVLAALLECSDDKVSAITTSASDVSQRCEMIKRLVVIENPGIAWRDWLLAVVSRITSELGPARNRYIHDNWHVKNLELIRTDRRGKVAKPQARMDLQYSYDTEHVTDPEAVANLIGKVNLVWTMLAFAQYDLRHWRVEEQPLEPHPEYVLASRPHTRWMSPQESEEARRQGQTPSGYIVDP